MIKLFAKKNILLAVELEPLTAGSVNVNDVEFTFDAEWDGLTKTAVFSYEINKSESEPVSVLLTDDPIKIPWEVLQTPGAVVKAGVYGTLGDDVVLPTIWVQLGTVKPAVKPGETAKEPTPDVYQQILAAIEAGKIKGDPGETPHIGENGNWYLGDVDTGFPSRGEKGDDGNVMYVTFELDETGNLIANEPDGYTGPTFDINADGELEVEVNG